MMSNNVCPEAEREARDPWLEDLRASREQRKREADAFRLEWTMAERAATEKATEDENKFSSLGNAFAALGL